MTHFYLVALWAFAMQVLAPLSVTAVGIGPDDGEALMQMRLDSKALEAAIPTTNTTTTTTSNPAMLAVLIRVRVMYQLRRGDWTAVWPGFRVRPPLPSHRVWDFVMEPDGNITSVEDWDIPLLRLPKVTQQRENYYMSLVIPENGQCRYEFSTNNASHIEASQDFNCPGLYPANAQELAGNTKALFDLNITNRASGATMKTNKKRCSGNTRNGGRFCATVVTAVLTYANAPFPHKHESAPHVHCNAQGDPHYRNWTKKRFDYQGGGELLLAKTQNDDFHTQVFNCPMGKKKRVSITIGVAVLIKAGNPASMVTWFNGTTRINDQKMPPGLWCLMDGVVTDGLASGGCSPAAGAVQILEMPIIKGPTLADGAFSEIQISKKVLSKKKTSIGYVLRVYADLPTAEANQTAGLCSADETNAHLWHVNDTYFNQTELATMNEHCCASAGDCDPQEHEGPLDVLDQWAELCECSTEVAKAAAIQKCASLESSKVDHDACLIDYCFTCDPDVAEGVVETAEEEEEGVPIIDISVLPTATVAPSPPAEAPAPPPPPPPAPPATTTTTTTTVTTTITTTKTTTTTTTTVAAPPAAPGVPPPVAPPPPPPVGGAPSPSGPGGSPVASDAPPPPADLPPPATTAPPAADSVGDPHCRNVKGEHFDIHTTGRLSMVTVPKKGRVPGGKLLVYALVTPVGPGRCAPTVIKRVDITGTWSPLGSVQLEPGVGPHGDPKVFHGGWPLHDVSELQNVSRKSFGRLVLQAGPVRILVRQRHGDKTKIDYLDLSVTGLQELGASAGGLLGIDDHKHEAQIAKGCKANAKISLSRMRFSNDAVEEEMSDNSTGRLLSRAEVPEVDEEE